MEAVATPTMGTTKSPMASSKTSSSTKRKRDAGPKFYAVKVGYKPGIYHSWADCLKQVTGYKNASFKSFGTLTDADNFLKNGTSAASSGKPQKFYAVQNGRVPGVYTDWPSAQAQITGWKQPKHRAFQTRVEAEAFVNEGPQIKVDEDGDAEMGSPKAGETAAAPAPPRKKTKTNGFRPVNGTPDELPEPGTGALPADAEDGFDYRIQLNEEAGELEYKSEPQLNAKKLVPSSSRAKSTLVIYTDGSALKNGQANAVAGIGVWFGEGDDRNLSEPLQGDRQSNNRAELTALKRALDFSPYNRNVQIFTDSTYAIGCLTKWYQNWQKNGWITASKKPVENKDLVEQLRLKIDERDQCGVTTTITWIKAHSDHYGNVQADKLAIEGAKEARENMALL